MGYSFLYSFNMDRTVQLYQMIPDLVIAILVEGPEITACWDDEDNCLLSEQNPYGIPAWKLFAFHFWTGPDTPLGRNWTLSPEPVSPRPRSQSYPLLYHPYSIFSKATPRTSISGTASNPRACPSPSFHTTTETTKCTLCPNVSHFSRRVPGEPGRPISTKPRQTPPASISSWAQLAMWATLRCPLHCITMG